MQKLLFSTNNDIGLAKSVASKAGLKYGRSIADKFPDKEIHVELVDNVQNKHVYAFGSTNPPSDNLLELLILINTLKENKARKITAIIPYFAYGKSDHIKKYGDSVSAKLMADILKSAGADGVITINLHSLLTKNFFKVPVVHLSAADILAKKIKSLNIKNLHVASPDLGGVKRAKKILKALHKKDLIIVKKHRTSYKTCFVEDIYGNPKNKNILIYDDMTQTGNTLIKATKELKKHGAKNIYVACVHLVPTGPALQNLSKSKYIEKIFITNTIPLHKKLSKKFEIIKIDRLISDAILKSSK